MNVRVEGHYRQGQAAVYVKFPEQQQQESIILARDGAGVWSIDPIIFSKMGVPDTCAEEWLATLL